MSSEPSHQDLPARERALIESARREAGEWRTCVTDTAPWQMQPGEEAFPGYDIIRELHRGGQGVVYEALQRSTHRRVAIKVLLAGAFAGEASLLRFEREVRLLASLRHPNIVVIHDSGIAQGRHYFVMDLISGEHLDGYCRSKALAVGQTVRLFRSVVDAVAFAHGNGIVHRDLKPANIIVTEDGNPYVLDFGLAKATDRSCGASLAASISATGDVLGTVRYMSPEQVSGHSDCVDARTDVHALAVILHELLAGSHPYGGGASLSAMIDAIRKSAPPRISTLRPETDVGLEEIILKAMSKEPARRYPSAIEMREDLDTWLGRQGSYSDRVRQPDAASRGRNRHRSLYASALVVGCFVLLAVGLAVVGPWGHFLKAGGDRRDSQSASLESGIEPRHGHVPPVTTARSAVAAGEEGSAALEYVRQNLPRRGLRIRLTPGGDSVRVEGSLLNEAEMQTLQGRLASVRDQVQLEVKVNPEAVRLLVQQALVEAGGREVRVRLEGKNNTQSLNVELLRTDSAALIEAVARDFVLDRSTIRFRAY